MHVNPKQKSSYPEANKQNIKAFIPSLEEMKSYKLTIANKELISKHPSCLHLLTDASATHVNL